MFDFLRRIFTKNTLISDCAPIPTANAPVFGEVSLADMVNYSLEDKWVFHGSPVKLEPGVDMLEPRTSYFGGNVVHMGDLCTALRFCLVRMHREQCDQMQGKAFYIFCAKKHRLVIYNGFCVSPAWYRAPITKSGYLYMSPNTVIPESHDKNPTTPVPITARAVVNQQTLADAEFIFAPEMLNSTKRWWGMPNTDFFIKNKVLPEYIVFTRQR
ncbi:MAG: hypothetical protein IJX89_00665 [Alphaproteobacteria bacterium]|nr:hypothetical protein [Alphaproteobacteria bacterium]